MPVIAKRSVSARSSVTKSEPAYTKGAQTRIRILEAAMPLFGKRGYSGTALGDVMAACGLTKGGFYAHFASKEALYLETVRTLLHRERAKYHRAPDEAPAEQRLKAFLDWMRESLAGDRPLGRQFLWMVLEPESDVTRHVIDEVFHSTYDELRGLLAERGRDTHPELVASNLLAVALLHEQIKTKIMRPLAKKRTLHFDTSAVLELMLSPLHGRS